MSYTITYQDENQAIISSNNPTNYDYNRDGVVVLAAPTIMCGEFRGWYTSNTYTTRITQLDQTISANTTIYAYIQITTQVQVLGSAITELDQISSLDGKFMLFSNSLDGSHARTLSGMSPATFSSLVAGGVEYLTPVSGSHAIATSLDSIRQEYFIDVGNNTELSVTISNYSNAKYILLNFTRGTNNESDNLELEITINGPTINSTSSTVYDLSIGSTIILTKSNNEWTSHLYMNPVMTEIVGELVDNSLSIRNYVYTGNLTFSPSNSNLYGNRLSIDVNLDDFNISSSSSKIDYKSVFIQFNNSSYEGSTDITTLNNKQGYLNLIEVQPTTLTYNSSTGVSTLKLTYDQVPAYTSSGLSGYTTNIPVKIMVVI